MTNVLRGITHIVAGGRSTRPVRSPAFANSHGFHNLPKSKPHIYMTQEEGKKQENGKKKRKGKGKREKGKEKKPEGKRNRKRKRKMKRKKG